MNVILALLTLFFVSIQLNKMVLDEKTNEDPLQFLINSNDLARNKLKILCQTESEESKKKWLEILKC